jgi:hypothetical protein
MIRKGTRMNGIKALLGDLEDYISSNLVSYERYHVPFEELEDRKDIRFARISLYEQNDSVTDQINDYRANLSVVNFAFDISVIRAYRKDNDTRGEEPLMDLRDLIIDWSKVVNAPALTNNYILAIGYQASANIIRNNKFVNKTLIFDAIRDLHLPQSPEETF